MFSTAPELVSPPRPLQETVAMSAIYIHAGATSGGVNELKSLLLQIMHPTKRSGCK